MHELHSPHRRPLRKPPLNPFSTPLPQCNPDILPAASVDSVSLNTPLPPTDSFLALPFSQQSNSSSLPGGARAGELPVFNLVKRAMMGLVQDSGTRRKFLGALPVVGAKLEDHLSVRSGHEHLHS